MANLMMMARKMMMSMVMEKIQHPPRSLVMKPPYYSIHDSPSPPTQPQKQTRIQALRNPCAAEIIISGQERVCGDARDMVFRVQVPQHKVQRRLLLDVVVRKRASNDPLQQEL